MSWLRKLFGGDPPPPPIPPAGSTPGPDPEQLERMLIAGSDARAQVYAALGELDSDVIGSLINPTFMGGPRWPSLRQGWRVIRREHSTIVASDGLSDPFDDDGTPLGFQVEVYAEAPGPLGSIHGSWLVELVYQVSQVAADSGRFLDLVQRYGSMSTVVYVGGAPEPYLTESGDVGVLVGVPAAGIPDRIELPDGPVRLLSIKMLLPSELAFLEGGGDPAGRRRELIERFALQPDAHLNPAQRDPVA